MKTALCSGSNFVLSGEFLWFGLVLHCDIFGYCGQSTLRDIRQTTSLIASSVSIPVYAFQTETCDPLKRKFIKAVGGRLHHTRMTDTELSAEMYVFDPCPFIGHNYGKPLQV